MRKIPYICLIRGGPNYSNIIAQQLKNSGAKVDVLHWSELFPLPSCLELPKWHLIYLRIGGAIRVTFMLTSQLQIMGYKLINNPLSIFRTNNKYLGAVLAGKVMEVPKTYLIGKRLKDFQKIPRLLKFPFVIKPVLSIQGKGVVKIENKEQLAKYLDKLDYRKLVGYPRLAQEFITYQRLIRVVMVGQEIIDAAYDEPRDDWKCSVCINPKVKPYPLSEKLKKTARQVKKITGQEICMLDIFEKDGQYIFNEINNQCDLSFMQQATGVNHAKKIASFLTTQARTKI